MDNCVFCKIVDNIIPSHKIYEDNDFIVILDIHPKSTGHALVISKQHYRWVYDHPQIGQYFEVAQKIINRQIKYLNCDYVSIATEGNDIPHAHVHLIPHFSKDSISTTDFSNIVAKLNHD